MRLVCLVTAMLVCSSCLGENAGVERAKREAAERESAEVARIRKVLETLGPAVGKAMPGETIVKGLISVGDSCAFIIDPDTPPGCAEAGPPGTCWGGLFALRKDEGWHLVGTGNRDELVFPPYCHVGIISSDEFRHFGSLERFVVE